MKKKLYLIDGTAVIFRSYFAFIRNPLINSRGENTGAIYGTISFFLRLIEKYNPQFIAISFDRKEKTFRHEVSEKYKANRPPAPDELNNQVEPIKEYFRLIDLPEISKEGYEADDILATLTEKYKNDFDVILVTGDKDFCQLVEDNSVVIYDPKKEIILNYDEVLKKYGITPEQFVDWLAICGDTADNIPGVRGIGPKGATKLLQEFGTLENIYKNIDRIKSNSIRTKLIESREEAFLSKKLAQMIKDINLDYPSGFSLTFEKKNLKSSIDFLKRYELNSLLKKTETILGDDTKERFEEERGKIKFNPILINSDQKLKELAKKIEKMDIIALDTETTSTDSLSAKLVGISISFSKEYAYYIPISHTLEENMDLKTVLNTLKIAFQNKLIVAHNFKYDYQVLKRHGWNIKNKVFDTMIADYLINPDKRHSLEHCALRYFEYEMQPISDLIGKGKNQSTFDLVPVEAALFYASEDANITFRLYEIYKKNLVDMSLDNLFENIEIPLLFVLSKMEENGVLLDKEILREISNQNQKRLVLLRDKIYEIAGTQFNLNSTQQLAKVLFEDLKIKPVKKTKTGFSTDISVLEVLAKEYEIAKYLMQYRQITKLESTYVKALPQLINKKTGRIHSSFNQTVAVTGRLSSSNPNLQNIPVRSEMGREIRKAFIPAKGYKIVSADYSQIELRILAILSKDEKMIEAFKNNIDIHANTAALVFGKDLKDITKDERRFAKVINFGLIYGMGAYRISKELDISRKEASEFIENYFQQFPTIKNFINLTIKKAKETGFVSTMLGRKLYLPELKSSNKRQVAEAERVAINMPIQGSAADLIKIAMINIHNKIKDSDDVKMIIQVHDELVFEVKETILEKTIAMIRDEMQSVLPDEYKGIIPLSVDVGVGDNWLEAH